MLHTCWQKTHQISLSNCCSYIRSLRIYIVIVACDVMMFSLSIRSLVRPILHKASFYYNLRAVCGGWAHRMYVQRACNYMKELILSSIPPPFSCILYICVVRAPPTTPQCVAGRTILDAMHYLYYVMLTETNEWK